MKAKVGRAGQRGKSIEERVGYALGHRVRVEILRLLNEDIHTAEQIAAAIGESRQNVHHHLKELLDGRMIEIAKIEKRRNADLYYYRSLVEGSFDREALEAMTPSEQQEICAVVVRHSTAELMAALSAGTLSDDPRVCLMWNRFSLDDRGREDLFDEQERFWARVEEISAESANRRAESGEETTSYVVAQWGFERARTAAVPPQANAD